MANHPNAGERRTIAENHCQGRLELDIPTVDCISRVHQGPAQPGGLKAPWPVPWKEREGATMEWAVVMVKQ